MQKFSYNGVTKLGIIYSQIWGVFGLVFSTGIALFCFLTGIMELDSNSISMGLLNEPGVALIFLGIFSLFIGWSVSFTFLNNTPTIWVTDDGIFISAYLFFRIKIVWSDILVIKDLKFGPFQTDDTLVFARRISLFHRAFGWIYHQHFLPGFIIRKEIEDYEYLLRVLRRKIIFAQKQSL